MYFVGYQAFCSGGNQVLRGKDGYTDFHNFDHHNVFDIHVKIDNLF